MQWRNQLMYRCISMNHNKVFDYVMVCCQTSVLSIGVPAIRGVVGEVYVSTATA